MKETSEIKVSVIIPVYNAESFIGQCLDSVCGQSFSELEVICVDDSSTDDSAEIIKARQKEDKRIRYIHQDHQFAGAARNTGLKEASGKYVLFPDADDFIDKETIRDLYDKAEETQADIVLCGGYRYDDRTGESTEQKQWLKTEYFPGDVFSRIELKEKLFSITNNAVWNKFFNRKFICDNEIFFQPLHNTNDMYFTMLSLACAERITYIDHPYIYYRVHISDSTQIRKREHPLDFLTALNGLKKALVERDIFSETKDAFDQLTKNVIRYNLVTVDDDSRAVIAGPLREHELYTENVNNNVSDDPAVRRINRLLRGVDFKQRTLFQGETQCLKEGGVSKPLCSVIICYPEDYHQEVFDSILRQKTEKCEIILIGDLSDEIASDFTDERITMIRTADQSKSCLRSIALGKAKGKYIYFAGDRIFLSENALDTMMNEAEENDLDLLFIGDKKLKTRLMKGISLTSALLDAGAYDDSLCSQMTSNSLLRKMTDVLAPGISDEDAAVTFRNVLCADRCAYADIGSVLLEKDTENQTYTYQDLYDHFLNYLEMTDMIRKSEVPLPENLVKLPYKEKEKAALIYEVLPEEEKLDQETMDAYERMVFNEEIVKPSKLRKQNNRKQKELENKLNDTRNKLEQLQKKYENILGSRSYRFAKLLAWLPRKIRKLLRKDGNEARSE